MISLLKSTKGHNSVNNIGGYSFCILHMSDDAVYLYQVLLKCLSQF